MTSRNANERQLDTSFAKWRKSSRSNPNGNECVEVSFSTNAVGLRDSKIPAAFLVVDHAEWQAFLRRVSAR
jgi:hypothetical protein